MIREGGVSRLTHSETRKGEIREQCVRVKGRRPLRNEIIIRGLKREGVGVHCWARARKGRVRPI